MTMPNVWRKGRSESQSGGGNFQEQLANRPSRQNGLARYPIGCVPTNSLQSRQQLDLGSFSIEDIGLVRPNLGIEFVDLYRSDLAAKGSLF